MIIPAPPVAMPMNRMRVCRIFCFLFLCLFAVLPARVHGEAEGGTKKSIREYNRTGGALRNEGEYEAAISEYQHALEQYPNVLNFRRLLAATYSMSQQYQKALEEQKVVIETSPKEEDYYVLGILYNELGEDERKVQAFYEEATRYGSEKAWEALAASYVHIRDYDGAVWACRKMVELNPDNDDARLYLAGNLARIHDYQAAASELSKIYDTPSEKILFMWGFFKFLAPPFILLSLMFFLLANHRLSAPFCHTTPATREILGVVGSIMLYFVFLLIVPQVFFNPLASYYREKVVTSLYLWRTPPEVSWRFLLSLIIPMAVLPAFFMRHVGIDIKSLFAVDREKARKILKYLFVGIILASIVFFFNVSILVFGTDGGKYPEDVESALEAAKALPLSMKLYKCIVLSSIEEFCIRGWIFLLLRRYFKAPWSVILSSMFFVFGHIDRSLGPLLDLFFSGIVYAYLAHKTRSLWPSSILHMAHNSISYFL